MVAENSLIDYVAASWSPLVGCTKCSPGCDHCFAIRQVWRMAHNPNPKIRAANEGLVKPRIRLTPRAGTEHTLEWTGKARCLPERLDWPLRWRKPKRILVPTLGDLFHKDVPLVFLDAVFTRMTHANHHRFLVLTKRIGRMAAFWEWARGQEHLNNANWPHIWPGVTVCNQAEADAKLPVLLAIPSAGHWVSAEPMLGPIGIKAYYGERPTAGWPNSPVRTHRLADWYVAGAETGPGARPAHPDWFRSVRDQCAAAGVPFFLKATDAKHNHLLDGVEHREIPDALKVGCE